MRAISHLKEITPFGDEVPKGQKEFLSLSTCTI